MRKWVRNILKGTSLSTALFVFQACYGMPPGYEYVELGLQVVDAETKKPIPNADVMFKHTGTENWTIVGKTDASGMTYIPTDNLSSLDLKFEAGSYQPKDTSVTDLSSKVITIKMLKQQ